MKHTVSLVMALAAAWLLWSGLTVTFADGAWGVSTLLLVCGALSIALVVILIRRMDLLDEECTPTHILARMLLYTPWLVWEVAKANIDVALRILNPRLPIRPKMIRVKTSQRTDLGRVIYANSITLTPGTVSVDIERDEIVVHALTHEAADGVESGVMDAKVTGVEGSN